MLPLKRRLLIVAIAGQLFVDLLGLVVLFSSFSAEWRQLGLTVVFVLTLAWDLGILVYLLRVTPVVAPSHPTAEEIKTSLLVMSLTILATFTGIGLLWLDFGFAGWFVNMAIGSLLGIIAILDGIGTYYALQ